MTKETYWVIGVHPQNGVHVQKLEFTDQDEEFLEDEEGWDSFDDYVKYYLDDEIAGLEQGFYSAVAVKNEERLEIIKALSEK